jgi:L-2-hydroxyglutarate oxidase LhgO
MSIKVDYLILGGGIIGLSISSLISRTLPKAITVLIEKESSLITHNSSRNSQVIHAGLYYSNQSLKTNCCLRGKELLYKAKLSL